MIIRSRSRVLKEIGLLYYELMESLIIQSKLLNLINLGDVG